jgi:hypothetical protein
MHGVEMRCPNVGLNARWYSIVRRRLRQDMRGDAAVDLTINRTGNLWNAFELKPGIVCGIAHSREA